MKIRDFVRMATVLAVLAAVTLFASVTAEADYSERYPVDGDFMYSVNGDDGTCTMEFYLGTDSTVVIPSVLGGYRVTKLGRDCFGKCTGVGSYTSTSNIRVITVPEGVVYMDDLFTRGLERINLPSTLQRSDDWGAGTEVVISPQNPYFCSVSGSVYSKDMKHLVSAHYGKNGYTFPKGVEVIDEYAFQYCAIGRGCFNIPEGVREIEHNAFSNWGADHDMTSITFPNSLEKIGYQAFRYCQYLESVTISKNVKEIGYQAFAYNSELSSVIIPSGVERIGYQAFYKNAEDQTVYFYGTKDKWNRLEQGADFLGECLSDGIIPTIGLGETVRLINVLPAKITSISNKSGGVLLSWAKRDNAVGYRIYRRPANGTQWSLRAGISNGAAVSWTDTSLKSSSCDGTKYVYRLTAIYGDEIKYESNYSVTRAITRVNTPKMTKIANVVNGVHVYWGKSAGKVDEYDVYRSCTKNGGYSKVATVKSTNYTDINVADGTGYYYRVKAKKGTAVSEASAAISTEFIGTPDITSRVNTVSGIRITWGKVANARGYAIYRKGESANAVWTRVKTIRNNTTFSWTDPATKEETCNGRVYHYTVRALTGSNLEILSGCRNTGRTMVRLDKPVIYSMKKKAAGTVLGNWSRNDKATGYEVRFMVGSRVYKTFVYGNNKIVKKTIENLPAGKTYKVQVRSYYKTKNAGTYYSSWSDPVNVAL